MSEIVKISKEYNLHLIEDCAHAVGTYYKNKYVMNFVVSNQKLKLLGQKLKVSVEKGISETLKYFKESGM